MKTSARILIAAILSLGLWSCGKENVEETPVDNTPSSVSIDPSSINAEAASTTVIVSVTAPSKPEVSYTADWISIADAPFNKDTYKMTVSVVVAANTATEERSADVVFTYGKLSATLKVSQAAAEETPPVVDDPDDDDDPEDVELPDKGQISKTLVTSGATAEAVKLYNYLYTQYREKMISGVIANVNWNHDEADKIAKATGKYPAINCYDFIHIYVNGNWINYSDLSPVTEWADAGGIVALMWHFNVPKSESTTVDYAGGSGVTCTSSETTFKPSNIFKTGTWENKWYYTYMDKVAAIILQLQEKGIAAIWRPFHEAAGNACAKNQANWTTAWFWWGKEGASVYKKLWTTTFDYFASKGIKNLIWVWTSQNYNGNSNTYNQDADWYPGDAYVDIVGRDLYGYTAQQNLTEFTQIQAKYPTKMVSLAECGNDSNTSFAKMSAVWAGGAQWSWFMPWYGSPMPDTTWWTDALGSSNIITRDKVKL